MLSLIFMFSSYADSKQECLYTAELVRMTRKDIRVNLELFEETSIDIGYRCRSGYNFKIPKSHIRTNLPKKWPSKFVLKLVVERVPCTTQTKNKSSKTCLIESWYIKTKSDDF